MLGGQHLWRLIWAARLWCRNAGRVGVSNTEHTFAIVDLLRICCLYILIGPLCNQSTNGSRVGTQGHHPQEAAATSKRCTQTNIRVYHISFSPKPHAAAAVVSMLGHLTQPEQLGGPPSLRFHCRPLLTPTPRQCSNQKSTTTSMRKLVACIRHKQSTQSLACASSTLQKASGKARIGARTGLIPNTLNLQPFLDQGDEGQRF